MPMPYSHLSLAQEVLSKRKIEVENRQQFLLGSLMPDMRYFTGLSRDKYHFPTEVLHQKIKSMSISDDFVAGYKLHLLIDEEWVSEKIYKVYLEKYPNFVRSKLTLQRLALLFEAHCLSKHKVQIGTILPVLRNDLTDDLEITNEHISYAVSLMNNYIAQPNLEFALTLAEETKLIDPNRIENVRPYISILKKNSPIGFVLNLLNDHLSEEIYQQLIDYSANRLMS